MDKEVAIKLSEHDAWRVLALLKRQAKEDDPVWRPYWQRLVEEFNQQIAATYVLAYFQPKAR